MSSAPRDDASEQSTSSASSWGARAMGGAPARGALRGRAGGAPTWTETVVAVVEDLEREAYLRTPKVPCAFSFAEIYAHAERKWDELCRSHPKHGRWGSMMKRVLRYGTSGGARIFDSTQYGASHQELFQFRTEFRVSRQVDATPQRLHVRAKRRREVSDIDSPEKGPVEDSSQRDAAEPAHESCNEDSQPAEGQPAEGQAGADEKKEDSADVLVPNPPAWRAETHPLASAFPSWVQAPSGPVRLSTFDVAPRLTTTLVDTLNPIATGFKGYRSVRASHGVTEGDWYFEVKVLPHQRNGGVRVGWSTRRADISTPVGYHERSAGYRCESGDFIHTGRLHEFGERVDVGDVLGCRLFLPPMDAKTSAEIEEADLRWLDYTLVHRKQGHRPPDCNRHMKGAFYEFYKNGKSQGRAKIPIENVKTRGPRRRRPKIHAGRYYPTISLFSTASAQVSFLDRAKDLPDSCSPIGTCYGGSDVSQSSA